ncbi:MAG: hypothetical protein QOF51_2195 [Chloroflexota bacterium]|jgi:hemerythrin superfamily protein|nr:hypothetical protein [Chloroflexota bacterium]
MAEKMMDAISMLEQDHRKVEGLFKEFEGKGDRAAKAKMDLARAISEELEVHTKLENEIFYPAAREVAEEMVAEAYEEHHVVDGILEEIGAMPEPNEQFDAKMLVLKEQIEHHVEEEEKEMFPKVKRGLGKERMDQLGEQMMQRKQALMRETRAA